VLLLINVTKPFFEQPVFQHLLCQHFLQIARLGTQRLHLVRGR
ncbi:uncharacterized protein METZ01_LOCUS233082, partial [marine metagenome]